MRIFRKSAAHFQKLMFTGTVFDFRKFEKCAFFNAEFSKVNAGTVNFDLRNFEKCAFFDKSAAHFQKLMFTGTVNFDY